MAKTRINLLTQEFKTTPGLRIAKTGSIGAMVVYIFILVLLFGVSYFLSTQKQNLDKQNIQLVSKINSLKKNEELLVTLKNRVMISQAAASKIGISPVDSLQKILAVMPNDIQLVTIRAENDGTAVILCTATSSKSIETFFRTLKDQKYATAYLTGFSLGEDGVYSFSLTLI